MILPRRIDVWSFQLLICGWAMMLGFLDFGLGMSFGNGNYYVGRAVFAGESYSSWMLILVPHISQRGVRPMTPFITAHGY